MTTEYSSIKPFFEPANRQRNERTSATRERMTGMSAEILIFAMLAVP